MLPKHHVRLVRVLSLGLVAAFGLDWAASKAQADNWMFRRSWYTHTPEQGGTEGPVSSRTGYREAFAGNHPRGAIRGGYRWNHIQMGSGPNVDHTVIRENFFDLNY